MARPPIWAAIGVTGASGPLRGWGRGGLRSAKTKVRIGQTHSLPPEGGLLHKRDSIYRTGLLSMQAANRQW